MEQVHSELWRYLFSPYKTTQLLRYIEKGGGEAGICAILSKKVSKELGRDQIKTEACWNLQTQLEIH